MKHLILVLALFLQAGGQPINIPISHQSFELGYGLKFSEDLGISPIQLETLPDGRYIEGVYRLTLSVQNLHLSYPGYYTAEVDFGTQELCEASRWGNKTITEITLDCPMPGYLLVDHSLPILGLAQGAKDLVLNFSSWNGWQVEVTAVSLTFTPTP